MIIISSNPINLQAYAYIDRGDVANWDYGESDFTEDTAYHDLDLSGIIPVNTKLVRLTGEISTTVAGKAFRVREKGIISARHRTGQVTQVDSRPIVFDIVVVPDVNGVIEYYFAAATWTTHIFVAGWWL